jgi:hypothetical protein
MKQKSSTSLRGAFGAISQMNVIDDDDNDNDNDDDDNDVDGKIIIFILS